MADSAAERARRARRHKKGDHSLCDPARRCELVEQAEANEAVAQVAERPAGRYGPRGQELHDALRGDPGIGPLQRVLLDEACRVTDRLDRLHSALEDKGTWLRYETDDGGDVVITIDSVLSETRQQEMALARLLADLEKSVSKAPRKPAARAAAPPTSPEKGAGIGGLSANVVALRKATPTSR